MSQSPVTQDHMAKHNYHQLAGTAQVMNLRSASASITQKETDLGRQISGKNVIRLGP
jgi:hypothetical protein